MRYLACTKTENITPVVTPPIVVIDTPLEAHGWWKYHTLVYKDTIHISNIGFDFNNKDNNFNLPQNNTYKCNTHFDGRDTLYINNDIKFLIRLENSDRYRIIKYLAPDGKWGTIKKIDTVYDRDMYLYNLDSTFVGKLEEYNRIHLYR